MTARLVRSVLVLLALVAACSYSTSCGGLDMRKLEKSISKHMVTLGFEVGSVSCPDDQKDAKKGDKFTCTATVADGFEIPVSVEVRDGKGNVYFEPAGRVVIVEAAVKQIEGNMAAKGIEGKVDCGQAKLLASKPGAVYDCKVTTAAGGAGKATITVRDDQGNVTLDWAIE